MMRHFFTLIAVVFLFPVSAGAQSGSVALQGSVSETAALSILPNFTDKNVQVVSSGSSVRLTLSADADAQVIRVPLLVRSNTGFKISAVLESQTVTHLSVVDVRPTGSLVSPEVVNAVVRSAEVDLNASQPLLVLTGPRVSLGGTLNSPNNALQVTLLIRPTQGSLTHLTFTATAGPPVP